MGTNTKESLLSFPLKDLELTIQQHSFEAYRARQIYQGLYQKNYNDFAQFFVLPKSLREFLSSNFVIYPFKVSATYSSQAKDTHKYVFELMDGLLIESVVIIDGKRRTLCISSQVGCSLKCSFCATGKMGLKRNLTAGEIVAQFLYARARHERIDNVVFMGMGEALLNYNEVKKALSILNNKEGIAFGMRRITLSTAGVPYAIKRLADENMQVRLAVSLHSSSQTLRAQLMPFSQKAELKELLDACRYYCNVTKNRITFEYVLLKDVNMSRDEVKRIAEWKKFLRFNVNLIPYNPVDERFESPSYLEIHNFSALFQSYGIETVVRRRKGTDISAACGQLFQESPAVTPDARELAECAETEVLG